MAPARVVRQRKLAKTTFQQVLREDQIESAEYSSLQNQYNVETGVEKSEEKARDHLHFILSHMTRLPDHLMLFPGPSSTSLR
jgi:enhancer of polycomb-like protein